MEVTKLLLSMGLMIKVAMCLQEITLNEWCPQIPAACKYNDTTENTHYIGDNITMGMTVKLQIEHYKEVENDKSKISLVGPSGDAISHGTHFITKQDREEFRLDFVFRQLDSEWGEFDLILKAMNANFAHTLLLHLEINLDNVTYKTKGTMWMPVEKMNTTLEKPMEALEKRLEAWQEQLEAWQQRLETGQKQLETGQKRLEAQEKAYPKMTEASNRSYEAKLDTMLSALKDNTQHTSIAGYVLNPILFIINMTLVLIIIYRIFRGNLRGHQQHTTGSANHYVKHDSVMLTMPPNIT